MPNEQLSPAIENNETGASIRRPSEVKDEVELKLLVPAGMLDQLREAPVIARRARDGGVASQLDAVYYDTPDCSLQSHGLSLRVRRSGEGYVQTLKRGPVHGRPFTRGEWEMPVAGVAPDLALLPVSEIGALLDRLAARTLDPIFVTKVRRWTECLDLPGAVVEVAFDEGSIEARERCEPLAEIELEVKAGDPRVLYNLGIELLEIAPLRIGTQSKADRGYGLAFGLPAKATKATAPAITTEHTVDDIVGAGCLPASTPGESGSFRGRARPRGRAPDVGSAASPSDSLCVAARRVWFTDASGFGAEARWLAKVLGAARDWDVFITGTLSRPSAALTSDFVDFDGLRQSAEPHRAVAYAAVRETLGSTRYGRFRLSLRHWIESRGWRNELESKSLAGCWNPPPCRPGSKAAAR
jgi:triphosphatase